MERSMANNLAIEQKREDDFNERMEMVERLTSFLILRMHQIVLVKVVRYMIWQWKLGLMFSSNAWRLSSTKRKSSDRRNAGVRFRTGSGTRSWRWSVGFTRSKLPRSPPDA